jgi:NAD(P)-dependent dehydrogenase (short-subunit alcohol dehydrogenase family)
MVSDQKVAVVTGSSSGIGLETSLMLARNDFTMQLCVLQKKM